MTRSEFGNRSSRRKMTRSEIMTVRLNPKTKLAVEIAAVATGRTLSGFIAKAVSDALNVNFEQSKALRYVGAIVN